MIKMDNTWRKNTIPTSVMDRSFNPWATLSKKDLYTFRIQYKYTLTEFEDDAREARVLSLTPVRYKNINLFYKDFEISK